jgi:aspartyl aminopeptidase
MAIERVTERSDGQTTERVIERDVGGGTTIVEKSGSGFGGIMVGVAVLAMVAIVAFFLLQANRNDALQTQAVTSAASSVADSAATAAEGVSNAANKAADAVTPAN